MSAEPRRQRALLPLLAVASGFNYLARMVLSGLLPLIARSFPERSRAAHGSLNSILLWAFTAASVVWGALSDRAGRRETLMGWGSALWGLASIAGSRATRFWALALSRGVVGIGQAGFSTPVYALVSDRFTDPRARSAAMAALSAAMPVGGAAAYVLAGLVGHSAGWRAVLLVVGIPGLITAGWLAALRLPPPSATAPPRGRGRLMHFFSRSFVIDSLAMTAHGYALGALATWMPTFLHEQRDLGLVRADVAFGLVTAVAGFAGTLAGGWLVGRADRSVSAPEFVVSGVSTLLAVPLIHLGLSTASPALYWPAIVGAVTLLFVNVGPANAIISNVTPATAIATAFAINTVVCNVLGEGLAPVGVGLLADSGDIGAALRTTTAVVAAAGLLWLLGATWYQDDLRRATDVSKTSPADDG